MEAKNFRVGNYVTSKQWGGIHKIEGIEVMKDSWELKVNGYVHKWEEKKYFDLEAITLTEEYFKRFGFNVEIGNPTQLILRQSNIIFPIDIKKNIGDFIFFIGKGYGRIIKYVHELQNLFLAITGEELELKDES